LKLLKGQLVLMLSGASLPEDPSSLDLSEVIQRLLHIFQQRSKSRERAQRCSSQTSSAQFQQQRSRDIFNKYN